MVAHAYLRALAPSAGSARIPSEDEERAVRALVARHEGSDAALVVLRDEANATAPLPGRRDLVEAIRAGRVTSLYSFSFARLARSLPALVDLLALCEARSIPVRLVSERIDTATASGRMLPATLSALASFEADLRAERSTRRKRTRLAVIERDSEDVWEEARAFVAAVQEAGRREARRDH